MKAMEYPSLKIGQRCIDCDNCVILCPENAIVRTPRGLIIEDWSCSLCGICMVICPVNAIALTTEESPDKLE